METIKTHPGFTGLEGRRVLVTGAASGMGRAVAMQLHQAGARLALFDRNADLLKAVAEPIGARSWVVDLTDAGQLQAAVDEAAAALGGLDGLVNSAGITGSGRLEDVDHDTWARTIAINLTSVFMMCKAALPHMAATDAGAIVNIASVAALGPVTSSTAYAASKGGVVAFSKTLAAEVAPRIRVNVVCPGAVDTPMMDDSYFVSRKELIGNRYALKRIGTADELANAIVFLLSSSSSFMTGTTLVVDGGAMYH